MSVGRLDASSDPRPEPEAPSSSAAGGSMAVDGRVGRPSFDVAHATIGFRRVISFRGVIDRSSVAAFRWVLEDLLERGEREIWVDLTAVRELACDAVDGMLLTQGRLLADHRRFAVICPPGPVSGQLAAGDHRFVIHRTLEDAHRMS